MPLLDLGDQFAVLNLPGPVAHNADARTMVRATGAFINRDAPFRQSTGFDFGPAGRVVVSVYSSGAIGRVVPEDVIGLICSYATWRPEPSLTTIRVSRRGRPPGPPRTGHPA